MPCNQDKITFADGWKIVIQWCNRNCVSPVKMENVQYRTAGWYPGSHYCILKNKKRPCTLTCEPWGPSGPRDPCIPSSPCGETFYVQHATEKTIFLTMYIIWKPNLNDVFESIIRSQTLAPAEPMPPRSPKSPSGPLKRTKMFITDFSILFIPYVGTYFSLSCLLVTNSNCIVRG